METTMYKAFGNEISSPERGIFAFAKDETFAPVIAAELNRLAARVEALEVVCRDALKLRAALGRDFTPAAIEVDRIESLLRAALTPTPAAPGVEPCRFPDCTVPGCAKGGV
jgi:hypothetical protein